MEPNEIVKIVGDLNGELWDNLKSTDDFVKAPFIYTTDGFVDIIKVADVHLWDSDNEPRLWNEVKEEYEDLETFLKKEYSMFVKAYHLSKPKTKELNIDTS